MSLLGLANAAPRHARSSASPATRDQTAPALRPPVESIATPLAISRRPNRRISPVFPRFIPATFATPRGASSSARPKPIENHPSPRANCTSLTLIIPICPGALPFESPF